MRFGLPEIHFAHPWWLAAGAAACLLLITLWYRDDARQERALARFVAAHLKARLTRSVSLVQRRMNRGLYIAAVALLFAALSGPQVGYRWESVSRRGYDIVFAIDTSRSMSTPDALPDRLTRAKLAIDDFTALLDGDAVGIVAFAGEAFLVCPITVDYGAFRESLSAIDTGIIPRGGTNISSAIAKAQAVLGRRRNGDRILILVTDGEDLEGESLAAARAAAQNGIKIYTVGVGTAAGELIPIPQSEGGGFVKDEHGTLVRSHLDDAGLKALAAATGGIYAPLGAQGEGLEAVFGSVFGTTAKHDIEVRKRKIYIDRYQWPLATAVALLLTSLLVGNRRRRRGLLRASESGELAVPGVLFLLALATGAAGPAHGATSPNTDEARGTAAYRSGRFPQAAQSFQQSLGRAPSSDAQRLSLQEDAFYNLGNALYRTGQATEKSDPGATIEKWTQALKAYDTALQLRADDGDSKYNRDLVQRKLDALRKPPPQNQGSGQGQTPPQRQPPQGRPPQAPPPPGGSHQPPPSGSKPPPAAPPPGGAPPAADQRQPGGMSQEEARELLDSEKGEEKHPLGVPTVPAGGAAEKPYKNW